MMLCNSGPSSSVLPPELLSAGAAVRVGLVLSAPELVLQEASEPSLNVVWLTQYPKDRYHLKASIVT